MSSRYSFQLQSIVCVLDTVFLMCLTVFAAADKIAVSRFSGSSRRAPHTRRHRHHSGTESSMRTFTEISPPQKKRGNICYNHCMFHPTKNNSNIRVGVSADQLTVFSSWNHAQNSVNHSHIFFRRPDCVFLYHIISTRTQALALASSHSHRFASRARVALVGVQAAALVVAHSVQVCMHGRNEGQNSWRVLLLSFVLCSRD